MHNSQDTSVVILAAGFSSRMKQAKFALKFDKKRTFLEKITQEYIVFGCKEIVVVLNNESLALTVQLNLSFPENVKIILNKYPERERFYSLQIGLRALKDSSHVFIHNVDNPFVDQDILTSLYKQRDKADYIVPTYKGKGGHPILITSLICHNITTEKDYNHNFKEYLRKYRNKKIGILNQFITKDFNDQNEYKSIFNKLKK